MPLARASKEQSPKGYEWLTFAVLAMLDWRKHLFSTSWLPRHLTYDASRTGSWMCHALKRVRPPSFCSLVHQPDAEHTAEFASSIILGMSIRITRIHALVFVFLVIHWTPALRGNDVLSLFPPDEMYPSSRVCFVLGELLLCMAPFSMREKGRG